MTESRSKVLVPVKGHPGVYRRGNAFVVRFRDPQGRSRKRHAKTLAEARAIRAEVTADISRGEYRAASRLTVAEYASSWRETFTGRTGAGVRPDTLKRYMQDLDAYVLPAFSRRRLTEIEHRHVKEFLAAQHARGISTSRVKNIYAPLRALLRTAVEEGLLRYDPTAGVRVTRVQASLDETEMPEPVRAYTEDELASLLAEVPEEWQLFVRFLAQTGLRISEATALRWQDIDLGAGRVKVSRRLYRGAFAPPKTRYGRRTVPLARDLSQDLWAWRKGLPLADEGSPVFQNGAGGHLDYHNIYSRVLRPAQKRAGLPTGAHVLRHTCATMLFRHGFNAKQVQVWLGHHSAAFTLSTYVHLLPEDLPEPPALGIKPTAVGQIADASISLRHG